jgi:hypothetical protein
MKLSGRVLNPAARLVVEADLDVDQLGAAAAPESSHHVGDRLIPPSVAMRREKRGRDLARVTAAPAGDHEHVVAEVIAQSLDGAPRQHVTSVGNARGGRPHST